MLQSLLIKNYALIDSLNIELFPGFSVITGETGAGKSIILGALGMILGQRADVKAIKPGAKRCIVEATFNLEKFQVQPFFDANELDYDGTECIIRRELSDTGKSRAFINDSPVSLALLKEFSTHLIDIHSQHQNLLLNEEHFQLNILDTVAHNNDLKSEYVSMYKLLETSTREFKQYLERIEHERQNADFLQFQLQEIDNAQLDEDEQEELEEESLMLENAERIKQGLFEVDHALSAEDTGVTTKTYDCLHTLQNVSEVFPKIQALSERLDSCAIELEDIAQEVSKALENINFDPARQSFVNERLNTIYALQKKHQCNNIRELLAYAEKVRVQLNNIEDSDSVMNDMRKENDRIQKKTQELANKLSTTRQNIITKVEKEIKERLQNLGMPNIRFVVQRTTLNALSMTGCDKVEFLFNANKNAPLQSIANIASGGEIARVMLSLKAMLTSNIQLPTIIFDEIDTGVSGQIAEKMALMMKAMSYNGQQVISITHLPQIAALGEYHYKVYKEDDKQSTTTHICQLSEEDRVTEIAHMLSGSTLTEAAINNAKELLNQQI